MDEQVGVAIDELVKESVTPEVKAAFLTALAQKGETIEEIASFVRRLREFSLQPPIEPALRHREILDVVGTGGDQLHTFNISTTVAILVAATGVTVAKHGNRAVTSKSGSADVLEALGIRIDLTPEAAARRLSRHGFAFFFAPRFHPAFKHIAPARKLCAERGQRTIFNFLGPLLNPARPSAQLVGVPRPPMCEPIARVLQSLGVRRAMVVCGRVPSEKRQVPETVVPFSDAWLDELSTLGENVVAEFYQEHGFNMSSLQPEQLLLQPATLSDLVGGDARCNAEITRRILRGEERGPKRDAVLLNAAAALLVAGQVRTVAAGWDAAVSTIASGKASAKLDELVAATVD